MQYGLELEVHDSNNSKGLGSGLEEVAVHNGMDTIIGREFHELNFQEQLQEIDDELVRFDSNGLVPPNNPMHGECGYESSPNHRTARDVEARV